MILQTLRITCASDDEPTHFNTFLWSDGDDLADLEAAVAKLHEYITARRDALRTALSPQPPIE